MRLTKRETRLLTEILHRESTTLELILKVGSVNIRDLVYRLRKKRFIIDCNVKPIKDRDGKTARPGHYSLPDQEKERVRKVLRAVAAAPSRQLNPTISR